MLSSYLALGLDPSADSEEIRARYLELVRKHPPEKDPDRFQEISAAYESIKSARRRVREKLFGAFNEPDPVEALAALGRAVKASRKRVGLGELLDGEEARGR